jgi:hypothetical protein
MGNYAEIRKNAGKMNRQKYNQGGRCYANGGAVKRPGVTVNVITGAQGPSGSGPTPGPMGANGPAMPPAPPPAPPMGPPPGAPGGAPPIVGNAALGKPAFKRGGGVKSPLKGGFGNMKLPDMAGAGSGVGRLKKARNPATIK